ncbi:hypothetical protein BGZ96_012634 [Linnemannia gamsii]|uniref:Uncharacterized protein n=1 Tax=Linnemannia gamsii TaxID=64522 RepID=A0ABQ7KB48_9FUNG|nr:hypothetical protein BGZ96_012634 [Linnemannia gamsii]
MLQQPRRLARSGIKRGPPPQPRPDQRVFRAQTPRQQRFWHGKLPILLGLAVLLLGYRIVRIYQYYQETKSRQSAGAGFIKQDQR